MGNALFVTTGANHVQAYALETGDTLWTGPGLTLNAIPTPVSASGRVYLTSGFRGQALMAIDLEKAKGNLEEAGAILWRHRVQFVPGEWYASCRPPLLPGGESNALRNRCLALAAAVVVGFRRTYVSVK